MHLSEDWGKGRCARDLVCACGWHTVGISTGMPQCGARGPQPEPGEALRLGLGTPQARAAGAGIGDQSGSVCWEQCLTGYNTCMGGHSEPDGVARN